MKLLIYSLLLFVCLQIQAATEFLRTIKPTGQGGDYTSLSAWEAGAQKDLVSSDEYAVGEIDGDWSAGADTTAVTIDGWTTDATRYIEVRTTTAARHTGKWSATKYVRNYIIISEQFTRIIGVQVSTPSNNGLYFLVGSGTVISCICNGGGSSAASGIVMLGNSASATDFTVRNSVAYGYNGIGGTGFAAQNAGAGGGTVAFDNNTIYSSARGFRNISGVTVTCRNCLSQSTTDGFVGTIGGNNNCSNVASDAPGTSPQTGTITFTDAANGDFGLVSGVAIGNGADLSGTFTDDLAGLTRTVPWDIGARKYVSASSPTAFVDVFARP